MELVSPSGAWKGFATGDAVAAEAWIAANLTSSTIRISKVPKRREVIFSAVRAPLGSSLLTRVRNAGAGDCRYRPQDVVFVCHSRGGRYLVRQGGHSLEVGRGDVFVAPCHRGFDFSFREVDFDVVSMPRSVVDSAAADLLGHGCTVAFTDLRPVSPAAKKHWLATMAYTYATVGNNPDALASPLVTGSLARNLAAATLATFPNSVDGLSAPGRSGSLPAAVRRAVSYIEAHADRDVSLAEIAEAARVTPRALQAGFRRHLDVTPLGHLRRVRMAAAHRELTDADPTAGHTVSAIASRWGFADPSHFATAYRRAYGRSPGETLRR
ncbi:MAG TPA: helix-turn-helix transcriptional regulator [Acidimicrobiales bacterium]|nr:helix-turn-helix transcriptional regulator [Acidimicrobiales bacterium]